MHRLFKVAAYLHLEFLARGFRLDDGNIIGANWPQEFSGQRHLPKRRGKPYTRQGPTYDDLNPLHERLQLLTALTANEGMKLIDDDVAQVLKSPR
ncbi:hypothetical protein D3C79_982720 [compost metagenome]